MRDAAASRGSGSPTNGSSGAPGAWARAAVVVVLGVSSLLVNVTTQAQLSGEAPVALAVARTASLLLTGAAVWAGVRVLAGWWAVRAVRAAVAGLLAGLGALVVHYGVGEVTGLMPAGSFTDNAPWFVVGAVTGAPLGLVGSLAHRRGRWGVAAAVVVPLGAVVEPWLQGWWLAADGASWPTRVSGLVTAVVLTEAGLLGARRATRRVRSG